jgi:hypothetical protein
MSGLVEKYREKFGSNALPPMEENKADNPLNKTYEKEIPFILYIRGKPIELSKKEALELMAQVVNILMYINTAEAEREKEKKE